MNMKRLTNILVMVLLAYSVNAQYTPEENFDKNWLFYNDIAEGAEKPDYNDAGWRELDLPHDRATAILALHRTMG